MAESRQVAPIDYIVNTIQHREMQEVIRKTLPPGCSQERFTQAVVAALKHRPDVVADCDRNSVYNAIVEAAKDGLLPDGRHGALTVFNTKVGDKWIKKCQFLIMPEGIIDKLAALGITVYAASVYAGEKIRIWNDENGQHIEHEPATFGERGERIGAYACAKIQKSGVCYVEAMNMEDLQAPRKVTKSKDKNGNLVGPWVDFPDRMEQKTCLHRVCKRLPNVEIPDDPEFRDDVPRPAVTIDSAPVAVAPAPKSNGRPAALQKVVDVVEESPPPHTESEVEGRGE